MGRKKEYRFVVTLKHPPYPLYNAIGILLCLMAVTAEIVGLLYSGFAAIFWVNAGLVAFIILYLVITLVFFNNKRYVPVFGWPLFAGALLWFFAPLRNLVISLAYILAAFLEIQLKFPQEIGFDEDEVAFNHFPSKHYSWNEIQNVILKDNIITIDFKNNRILQKETETDTKPELEKEFNDFCRQQLSMSALI
jgi:hypothetical protein